MTKREARKIVRIRLNEGINLTSIRERIVDINVWEFAWSWWFKAYTISKNHTLREYRGTIERECDYFYLDYIVCGKVIN